MKPTIELQMGPTQSLGGYDIEVRDHSTPLERFSYKPLLDIYAELIDLRRDVQQILARVNTPWYVRLLQWCKGLWRLRH